jgi:N-carbamoylputrescine amidase
MIPVVASNRQGTEILLDRHGQERQRMTFYGRSFITDATGQLVAHATEDIPSSLVTADSSPFIILTSTIDPEANRRARLPWGLFRDRRPELYKTLLTLDGKTTHFT